MAHVALTIFLFYSSGELLKKGGNPCFGSMIFVTEELQQAAIDTVIKYQHRGKIQTVSFLLCFKLRNENRTTEKLEPCHPFTTLSFHKAERQSQHMAIRCNQWLH